MDIFWYQIYSAKNWGYILIWDIFCQQLADIFWYWIYSANNWEIYVNYGVFVRPSGAGLQIVHLLEYVMCIFLKKEAYSATLHPPIDIYPPIVGRIYSILIYKFNLHIFPNCWQNISNTNISIQLTYIPQYLAEYIQNQPTCFPQ